MTQNTYYDILGVSPDADTDEIKTAYRKKAKKYHPDRSKHKNAETIFNQVQTAKEVLTNPVERARYERMGHTKYVNQDSRPVVSHNGSSTPDTQHDTPTETVQASAANANSGSPPSAQQNEATVSEYVTGRANEYIPSAGIGSIGLFNFLKRILNGATWLVNTTVSCILVAPYGVIGVIMSMLALTGVIYDTALYITLPSLAVFLSIVAYMVMDPKLGISGFGSSTLLLLAGRNYEVVPGGDGFYILVTTLAIPCVLAFIQQARYDRTGRSPPTTFDRLLNGTPEDTSDNE